MDTPLPPDAATLERRLGRERAARREAEAIAEQITRELYEAVQQLAPGVAWHVPQRGTNAKLIELADQNARHLLESLLIEAFDIEERAADPVYALGRDLGLAEVPRSLVCIDISTNQGRDTVGSLVWFEAGRPRKAEYRRFKIRGPGQQDDFAAVHEVVTRFLQRRLQEGFGDLEVARDRLQQQIATVDASAASTAGTVGSRVETGSPAQVRRRRL